MPRSSSHHEPILVTGATGAQGGATARALLAHGHAVRVLTRQPNAAAAQALARSGAQVAAGDMDDPASLDVAMAGVRGVFSVQLPSQPGKDSERQQAFALIAAARKAGVNHFVHTSVAQAGKHTAFPRWGTGYWMEKYWTDKWDVEEAVRNAGFSHWTVLKPAFLMENYVPPKSAHMFPHLGQGRVLTAFKPATRLQLIAADDVGTFVRAAFEAPDRFDRQDIDLAAEDLTMDEVAAKIGRAVGKPIVAQSVSPDAAVAAGLFPGWVRSQEWSNEVSYGADIGALAKWSIPLTSFDDWLKGRAAQIVVNG